MVKAFLFLLALLLAPSGVEGAAPQDRLAPILERWRSGREEERLQALRDAAALRKAAGDASLASFAEAPVPETWTRPDELIDLVAREKILPWYGLLLPLLSSRDAALRLRVLEELARRDLGRYSGPVVPKLKDPDSRVAWQAAYTLIQMDARGRVPEIVPLLKGPDASLRPNALHALLHLGSREHGPLLEPLLGDADPGIAMAAVQALGRFQARASAGKILRFLDAPEPSQRQAAIAALASMGAGEHAGKIAERLNDDQVLVRWEAVRALGRLKARQYAARIVASVEDDGGEAPGLEAMGSLGLRELAPHIVPFLATPDPGIRWRAVRALGEVDAKDDAGRLAEMLKDTDSFVRLCALQALAALGAREHAGDMLALLKDDESDVCQGAAEETWALAAPEQLKTVLPLLGNDDPFIRWSALHLLVGAGAKSALPSIVSRLRQGPLVDRDVVWAIGRLEGGEHRDKVAEALRNDDGLVRQQAAFALARLSDRTEDLEAADGAAPGATQLAAAFALARLGRKDRRAASALLREFVLRRDEPDYQLFPDEIFDALAAGFEKDLSAALAREVKAPRRIESVKDLEAILSKAGLTLAVDGLPALRRRLPAGSTMSARRALEWSFGGDARIVPEKGRILVMDSARALEHWQKRLDAP